MFEYKELVKYLTVSIITITENEVCTTIKNLDHNNKEYFIDMIIFKDDVGVILARVLSAN